MVKIAKKKKKKMQIYSSVKSQFLTSGIFEIPLKLVYNYYAVFNFTIIKSYVEKQDRIKIFKVKRKSK